MIYWLLTLAIVGAIVAVALTVGVVTVSENILGVNVILKKNGTISDYMDSKNKDIGASVSYTPFSRTNPNPLATINGNPIPVSPIIKTKDILKTISPSSGLAPHNA